MIVPGSANPLLLAGSATTSATVGKSLRFRKSASSYLARTPSTAGNRKTWTISFWIKRGSLWPGGTSDANFYKIFDTNLLEADIIYRHDSDRFQVSTWNGSSGDYVILTRQLFRDVSSWTHFVVAFDTTQTTPSNRIKIYCNGDRITAFDTENYPVQGFDTGVNAATEHNISRWVNTKNNPGSNGRYLDGYLYDFNLVDGQQLDPSSFGQFNATTGVWEAKKYTGAYGTNGFRLDFSDATTAAKLCEDKSGNNNHWTPNNISLANDATYDSMNDVPPVYGLTADVQPKGNYATLNPVFGYGTTGILNGNLDLGLGSHMIARSTMSMSSGKWYAEFFMVNAGANSCRVGIAGETDTTVSGYLGSQVSHFGYAQIDGGIWTNGLAPSIYYAAYNTGDMIGVALDMDGRTLSYYKNNALQGTINIPTAAGNSFYFVVEVAASTPVGWACNFGQRPFKYTPPAGFRSLCSTNLPEPSIVNGSEHMAVTLDTGANILTAAQAKAAKDLIWIKDRANANNHQLIDVVRGANVLQSNTTAAESAYAAPAGNSVSWAWKGGSSTIPTGGTITPTGASVNRDAGFSIIAYTGNGVAGATVPHGLGIAPSMIIIRNRSGASWLTYHSSIGNTGAVFLNLTNATTTSYTYFNNTSPNPTVFSVGDAVSGNGSTNDLIAYCWTPIPGYSSFGSYVGNQLADGPFAYCGFKPKWVLIKPSSMTGDWIIYDTSRNTHNAATDVIFPNLTDAQTPYGSIDILSNGFKPRYAGGASLNGSGATYIYAAFAENPFKYALAR